MSSKPVVLVAEKLSPATVGALGPDFEIRLRDGADRAELLTAIADADALLVRSATTVDAEAFAAAKKLKVVARAGVGLDNVDVSAATQAGVMVVNAPTSNIVTAAELACGPLIATARNIPQADVPATGGSFSGCCRRCSSRSRSGLRWWCSRSVCPGSVGNPRRGAVRCYRRHPPPPELVPLPVREVADACPLRLPRRAGRRVVHRCHRAATQDVPLLVASPRRRSRAAVSPYRPQRNQSRKVFSVWA
ncbi:hypothetical protein [Streptomyces sp. BRA346]|uniref:hypothetical protein n=1 Tax=Streptomyces sp. BRA346 TaxID=2878199 RepID=UPI0040641D16